MKSKVTGDIRIEKMKGKSQPNVLPFLENLEFARMVHPLINEDHKIKIDNQESLSSMTYDMMNSMVKRKMALSKAEFVRMWKTLILKRAQDVYTASKGKRPENLLLIGPFSVVPAPLGDLLNSMGYFQTNFCGGFHHIVPPANNGEDFWTVDNDILYKWSLELGRFSSLYTLKEFPYKYDCSNRALVLTRLCKEKDSNGYAAVKCYTQEPKDSDRLICSVNDELFENERITAESCGLTSESFNISEKQSIYVADFVKRCNS
jgi:hypothetical protein